MYRHRVQRVLDAVQQICAGLALAITTRSTTKTQPQKADLCLLALVVLGDECGVHGDGRADVDVRAAAEAVAVEVGQLLIIRRNQREHNKHEREGD